MDLDHLIEALRRPAAYPHAFAGPVRVLQTHISVLFFAGEMVYKVKKPVDMGFLDYSTLAQRKHFCEEELRLNRRLARDVYRRVVPITRGNRGDELRIGGPGEVVEHAVEMLRLPENRMLSAMLERGELDRTAIEQIVALLTAFHRECPTGPGIDEHGTPDELIRQTTENLRGLTRFAGAPGGSAPAGDCTLSPILHDHLTQAALGRLEQERERIAQRVRAHRVREGHGDLHAGNICLRDGDVVVYDCIEFAARYRCRDVACELAFLAMDLDERGFRAFAQDLIRSYADAADDAGMPDIVPLYKLMLAIVRGKVTSLRCVSPGLDRPERDAARREAMRYLHLAAAYTLPPPFILMCGLPGTGKSWAARAIAHPFEAVVLRSDVVRKTMAGLAPTAHAGDTGIYTPAFTERTYAALLHEATNQSRAGRAVVVDATFPTAARRRRFLACAATLGTPALVVERDVPPELARARLDARADDHAEPSDADRLVYQQARMSFEPPREVPAVQLITIADVPDEETVAARVIDALIGLTAS